VKKSDGEIAKIVENLFDMRPAFIEERLKLGNPIYLETAAYGHMGRKNETVTKHFENVDGTKISLEVELFTWEKLDFVPQVKAAFGL
jgi:S-adenosylmethionine synthetase